VPLLDASTPVRWTIFLAVFPLVGALVFRWLVKRRLARGEVASLLVERARVAGLVAAMVLIPALALKLYFQVRGLAFPGDPISWDAALPVLTGTSWGTGWEWQAGAALVALVGFLLAARSVAGWWIAWLGALLLVWTLPLTGHAVEYRWGATAGVALQGLHVAGGAGWLGTLAVLVAASYPALRGRPDREATLAQLVGGFSPLALTGAGMVAVAGVLLSLSTVASWGALWRTTYGITLLIKLALLGGILLLGYHNWQRVRPALGAAPGAARLARSASMELALGTLLLAVTAVLVALPAPGIQ
jgi:putative copper export protein